MNKEAIIEQIKSILDKVEDEEVLKDMLNLLDTVYRHYISGDWGL